MDRPDIKNTISEVFKNFPVESRREVQKCQQNGLILGVLWGMTFHALRQIAAKYKKVKKPSMGKDVGAFLFNLVLGYLTYTPICVSKAMEPLIIKQYSLKQSDHNSQGSSFKTQSSVPMEENASFQSTLNPDLDGPDSSLTHLSLSYESNPADNLILEEQEEAVKPKFQTTYDELRRQNRESYRVRTFETEGGAKHPSLPLEQLISKPAEPPKRVKTNQYGDLIE